MCLEKRDPWKGGYHGNETRADYPAIGFVENGKPKTYETSGRYDVTALPPRNVETILEVMTSQH